MTLGTAFYYLILWSVIGFTAFSAYVFMVFRTGIVYTARKQDGTLKERIPPSGYLNMLILLISIVGFQCLANYFGLVRENIVLSFFSLFLLNFGHYLILFIFDSVIIDGLVLSVWRPKFLSLPDTLGRESMKKHILVSIPIGTIAGIGLTGVSTVISYFALFRG
jgi:hypothetical protein